MFCNNPHIIVSLLIFLGDYSEAELVGEIVKKAFVVSRYKGDKLVDAKNIMSLLMLGAGKGTTLRLVLDGADEEQALSEIQALFAAKFYEAD